MVPLEFLASSRDAVSTGVIRSNSRSVLGPMKKMFVNYAGAVSPVHDPESCEVHAAAVFVAVLGRHQLYLREAGPSKPTPHIGRK